MLELLLLRGVHLHDHFRPVRRRRRSFGSRHRRDLNRDRWQVFLDDGGAVAGEDRHLGGGDVKGQKNHLTVAGIRTDECTFELSALCQSFQHLFKQTRHWQGLVVVDQLVDQSLKTPKVGGSNAVIGKNLYRTCRPVNFWKTNIKKRMQWMTFKRALSMSYNYIYSMSMS